MSYNIIMSIFNDKKLESLKHTGGVASPFLHDNILKLKPTSK